MGIQEHKKDILININNVNKWYGEQHVLQNVTLQLYRGEVIALLGVNGAGKTTLSSLIAAVHPPSSGDILYKSESLYKDVISYRSVIGYCPQKISDTSGMLSVYEQLWFAGRFFGLHGDALQRRIEEVLDSFLLQDVKHRSLSELSGGYKQRFALARSIIHYPQLVVLDEPTVALDPHVRRQLWNYILKMRNDGVTVVLTTHYLDEAEYVADRICILDKGKIVFIGVAQHWVQSLGKTSLEDAFLHMLVQSKGNLS